MGGFGDCSGECSGECYGGLAVLYHNVMLAIVGIWYIMLFMKNQSLSPPSSTNTILILASSVLK